MVTLLSSLAFADAAAEMDMAPCMEAYVSATVPAAGATDVPVDVAPALIWADDCSMGGSFQLRLELDGELVAEHRVDAASGSRSGVGRMPLEQELLPNSEYRLVIQDSWQETELLFTTGEGLVQGAAPPVVDSFSVEAWENGDGFSLSGSLSATQGADPDELSLLILRSLEGEVLAASDQTSSWLWFNEFSQDVPEELCVELVQQDGAGTESDPVVSCAVPSIESGMGCSTSPLNPSPLNPSPLGASLLIGLAGLLAVRRES